MKRPLVILAALSLTMISGTAFAADTFTATGDDATCSRETTHPRMRGDIGRYVELGCYTILETKWDNGWDTWWIKHLNGEIWSYDESQSDDDDIFDMKKRHC